MLSSGGLGEDFQLSSWFVRWKSNYTAYTQRGLVMACLAVFEKEPGLCSQTLSNSLRAWEYALYGLYPDGVWLEGKTYADVVYLGIMQSMAAMECCVGSSYSILDYPGVENGLKTLISYDSPVAAFCFGDDNMNSPFSSCGSYLRFFAKYYKNNFFSAWREFGIDNNEQVHRFNVMKSKLLGYECKDNSVNYSIYDAIFYHSSEHDMQSLEKVHVAKGGEIFTYHENIFDKDAIFVAAAGGPTRHYHFHEDSGDFMICKNGELWTWDFGQGDYNLGTIFTRFSGRAEAHNTLVINPSENMSQKQQSFAPICDYSETENGAYAEIDLTEVYSHHGTDNLVRRFDIENGIITITDNMNFYKSVRGYWIMHTPAEVIQVSDNTVALHQNGKCLYLNFSVNGAKNSRLILGKSRPLEESPKLKNDIKANSNVNSIKLYFDGIGNITISAKFSD